MWRNNLSPSRLQRLAVLLLILLWSAAVLVMLFHNLAANPQVDTQLFTFSVQFLRDLGSGHVADAFLAMRKYPLLPVAVLALLEAKVVFLHLLIGTISSVHQAASLVFLRPELFHLAARFLVLGGAIATVLFTFLSARKIFRDPEKRVMVSPSNHDVRKESHAITSFDELRMTRRRFSGIASVMLLLTSILFLTFATSMRPHVLVTAMTMFTFWLSLRMIERPTAGRGAAAFLSAGLAFATLQSGAFAFLFPVWALFQSYGWSGRTIRQVIALGTLGGLLSLLFGYTHALGWFLSRPVAYGLALGNTDMDAQPWTGAGFVSLIDLLVWSEPLIAVAAVMGVIGMIRKVCHPEPVEGRHAANVMVPVRQAQGRLAHHDTFAIHPLYWSALAYVLLYSILFGLNGNAPQRFFLPIIPFLALLGTPVISLRVPQGGTPAAAKKFSLLFFWCSLLLGCAVSVRFLILGLQPDTYQQAAAFLQAQTTGPIASQVPYYFLGIPLSPEGIKHPTTAYERFIKERVTLSGAERVPGARVILPHERWREASVYVAKYPWVLASDFPKTWTLCAEFPSVEGSDSTFLWGDVPRALPRLLTAKALGPGIRVYCRHAGSRIQRPETK